MITVKRRLLGNFYLYTPKEADDLGLDYNRHWSKVDVGEWTITDDNLVVQCRAISEMTMGKSARKGYIRKILKFPFGQYIATFKNGILVNKKPLNAKKYIKARAFNRTAPITFGARIAKMKKWEPFFKTYANWKVQGMATRSNLNKLAPIFLSEHTEPELALKVILRQKEVKKRMEQAVVERMTELGIEKPESYAMHLLKKAAEMAEKDRNPDAMIKVAKEVNLLLDAYPKKSTVVEQLEAVNTKMLSDNMDKEEQKLKLSRSTTE